MKKLCIAFSAVLCMVLILTCCDKWYYLEFKNNTDYPMLFYPNVSDKDYVMPGYGGEASYDSLSSVNVPEYAILVEPHDSAGELYWWGDPFKPGVLVHVYVFSKDSMDKRRWHYSVKNKLYWFAAVECPNSGPIQFPEGFTYMGE